MMMSQRTTKLTVRLVRPAKTQISLRIHTVWSESSLIACAFNSLQIIQRDKWELLPYCITKTCLYNFEPLKPHFYVIKLGFRVVYIIFLISAQKHGLWVLVRIASVRKFLRVPTISVLSRNMKNIRVSLSENFRFLEVKFSMYLNRRVFVMGWMYRLIWVFAGHTGLIVGFVMRWLIHEINCIHSKAFWLPIFRINMVFCICHLLIVK